jgi:hypothetical protein
MAAVITCSAAGSAWGLEGDGLMPSEADPWPRWQGRLSLATANPLLGADAAQAEGSAHRLAGATVLGDYYFTRSLPRLGDSGGFRATSGVFLGTRFGTLLSTTSGTGLGGRPFSMDRRPVGGLWLPGAADPASDGTIPYVGIGYTGVPSRGGWGFSADVGVMALTPEARVKLGGAASGGQSLDDVLRDLRLSPLVQLGVSYSF